MTPEIRTVRAESEIFLAVADGVIVGFTQLYPLFSSVSMKRLWLLSDLFVALEARTSGAGGALLERAERWALDTGAKGLTLDHPDDERDRAAAVRAMRLDEG